MNCAGRETELRMRSGSCRIASYILAVSRLQERSKCKLVGVKNKVTWGNVASSIVQVGGSTVKQGLCVADGNFGRRGGSAGDTSIHGGVRPRFHFGTHPLRRASPTLRLSSLLAERIPRWQCGFSFSLLAVSKKRQSATMRIFSSNVAVHSTFDSDWLTRTRIFRALVRRDVTKK